MAGRPTCSWGPVNLHRGGRNQDGSLLSRLLPCNQFSLYQYPTPKSEEPPELARAALQPFLPCWW